MKLQYEYYEDSMYGIVTIPENPKTKNDVAYKLAERLRMKRDTFTSDQL